MILRQEPRALIFVKNATDGNENVTQGRMSYEKEISQDLILVDLKLVTHSAISLRAIVLLIEIIELNYLMKAF